MNRSIEVDLDQYEEWATGECLFLIELLRKEGVEAVLETCQRLGLERMQEICNETSSAVYDFLSTPKPKRKAILHRIEDREERHAFLIAAAYEARCAQSLLALLCERGINASAGIAKSFLMLQAGSVARDLMANYPSMWPFDEGDPFDEGLDDFDQEPEPPQRPRLYVVPRDDE